MDGDSRIARAALSLEPYAAKSLSGTMLTATQGAIEAGEPYVALTVYLSSIADGDDVPFDIISSAYALLDNDDDRDEFAHLLKTPNSD